MVSFINNVLKIFIVYLGFLTMSIIAISNEQHKILIYTFRLLLTQAKFALSIIEKVLFETGGVIPVAIQVVRGVNPD